MKAHLALAVAAVTVAVLSVGGFSCGTTLNHVGLGGSGGNNSSGPGHPAGTGGGAFAGPSSGPGNGCTTTHCSSDLHDVLDCHGNVVKQCPIGSGLRRHRLRRGVRERHREQELDRV